MLPSLKEITAEFSAPENGSSPSFGCTANGIWTEDIMAGMMKQEMLEMILKQRKERDFIKWKLQGILINYMLFG